MKTILFSLCYIDGPERLKRNQRYLKYYNDIKSDLGFDAIVLADNASDLPWLSQLNASIFLEESNAAMELSGTRDIVYTFAKHLPRGSALDYPYCWRGLDFIRSFIQSGFDKVVCIDSDCFVLTKKLATYIKNINSGWESFWVPSYNFPSAELHVLCRDAFPIYLDFVKENHHGKLMETALPFTKINKDFIGDRYGERGFEQSHTMDYYGQATGNVELTYHG